MGSRREGEPLSIRRWENHVYIFLASVIFYFMFKFVVVYVIYMKNGLGFQKRSHPKY
jgi:hypothetical protein